MEKIKDISDLRFEVELNDGAIHEAYELTRAVQQFVETISSGYVAYDQDKSSTNAEKLVYDVGFNISMIESLLNSILDLMTEHQERSAELITLAIEAKK